MRLNIVLLLVVVGLGSGCAKTLDMSVFNDTFKLKFESRAAKSYRILSYENTTSGKSFDGLYFDSECELVNCAECEEDGPICEPPPINP